jgi:hypothetical protein
MTSAAATTGIVFLTAASTLTYSSFYAYFSSDKHSSLLIIYGVMYFPMKNTLTLHLNVIIKYLSLTYTPAYFLF